MGGCRGQREGRAQGESVWERWHDTDTLGPREQLARVVAVVVPLGASRQHHLSPKHHRLPRHQARGRSH